MAVDQGPHFVGHSVGQLTIWWLASLRVRVKKANKKTRDFFVV